MSISSKFILALIIVSIAGSPLAFAQDKTKPAAPLVMDPGKPPEVKPATRPVGPMPPLAFKRPLPTTKVATLDGKPVGQDALLQYLIRGNWQIVVNTLILANLLEIELKKANITVTEEEIAKEQDRILQRSAPGKTSAQVKAMGVFNEAEVRRQAWLAAGWDKILIAENKLKPEQAGDQPSMILKQLLIRQKMDKYDVKQRGQDPGPPPGLIAQVKEKEGTEVRSITADHALDFLMGLVKPGSLREATEDVVDSEIVNRELAKASKAVPEEEVEGWAASMQEKYKPPFDWRMICQFKQTTPDQERERWRRIQAWKRVTGFELAPETLKAFITEYEDHFAGTYRNVSHILIATRDRITDLPATPEQEAEAKAKAEDLVKKLEEGLDFGWVAEHYSDDATTAKGKGVLTTPIKRLGGGLDPKFQEAAWKLAVGEVSPPIKSKFGWHIIKCDKLTPGTRTAKDFEEPSYKEWIIDEYETARMREWLNGIRTKAKVEIVPNADLFKLKDLKFSEDAPGSGK